MKKFLPLTFLLLLALSSSGTGAVPTKPAVASSPAQVGGILDRVVARLAARRDGCWHRGDYPRVIALDRIITEADPHYLECYETGAWLMESLGNLNEAEAYYRQAVANNPLTSESYYNLGFFYFNTRHDYRRAANIFRQGTRQRDADLNDWKMLAHSYKFTREYDREVATWRHIKARWPNGVAVDRNMTEALARQRAATGETPAP